MRIRFKILILLLILLSIIGCGSKKSNKNHLKISTWKGGGEDFLSEMANLYQKENPQIKIEVEALDATQYDNNMKIRNTASQLSDIFTTRVTTMEMYKDSVISLDDIAASSINPYAAKFKVNGKIQGIPIYAFREYIYYNKHIFNELGLKTPTTWSEFISVVEKIKNNNKYIPLSLGAKDSWVVYPFNEFMPFLESKGDNVWSNMANDDTPFSKGKPFYEAYKKINQLYSLKPAGDDPLGYGWTQGKDMFLGEKTAMIAAGQWFWGELGEEIPQTTKDNIGVFLLPIRNTKEDKFRTLTMAETFLSIPKTTKNKELAKDFINFIAKNSDKVKSNKDTIQPNGESKVESLFASAVKKAKESGELVDVLNHGGGDKFLKISNSLQFDVKAMGQEMLLDENFESYMEEYNKKWSEARKKIN